MMGCSGFIVKKLFSFFRVYESVNFGEGFEWGWKVYTLFCLFCLVLK